METLIKMPEVNTSIETSIFGIISFIGILLLTIYLLKLTIKVIRRILEKL